MPVIKAENDHERFTARLPQGDHCDGSPDGDIDMLRSLFLRTGVSIQLNVILLRVEYSLMPPSCNLDRLLSAIRFFLSNVAVQESRVFTVRRSLHRLK